MNVRAAFNGYTSHNIDASKSFYDDVLGITCSEQMGGLKLTINEQQVFIYPKEDHQPALFTVLNFVVSDINAAVDEMTKKGVVFERYDTLSAIQDDRGILRGKDVGMGPNIAWFKDPSDNILALIEE